MAINVSLLVPQDTGYLFAKEFVCGLSSRNGFITKPAKQKVKQIMQEKGYEIANWWEPKFGNHYIVLDESKYSLLKDHLAYIKR